jgi:hypothetical protein
LGHAAPVALLQIFLLAVGSMFWPLLLVVVLIALRTSRPLSILVWFYLGGLITTVTVGAALVLVLQGSPLMTRSRLPSAPWIDIVLGTAALLIGLALRRAAARRAERAARRTVAKKQSKGTAGMKRLLENGGPLAFVAGIGASIVPGPLVLIALSDIAQLGYAAVPTVTVILVFYLVVFAFLEVPMVGFVVAPEWTATTATAANEWMDRNLLRLAAWALIIVGAFEVVRGIVRAVG